MSFFNQKKILIELKIIGLLKIFFIKIILLLLMFPYFYPNYYYPNYNYYSFPNYPNNNMGPPPNYQMSYPYMGSMPPMPPPIPPSIPPVVMGYQPPTQVQNSYPYIPNQVSIDPTPTATTTTTNNNMYTTPVKQIKKKLEFDSPPQIERKKLKIQGGMQVPPPLPPQAPQQPPAIVIAPPPPNVQQQNRYTPQEEYDLKEASKILEEDPKQLLNMSMDKRRYYMDLILRSDKDFSRTYEINFINNPRGKDPGMVIEDISDPAGDVVKVCREYVQLHKYIKVTISFRSGFIGSDDAEYIQNPNIDTVRVWKFFECEPIVMTESELRYIPDMIRDRVNKSIGELFQTERSSLKFRRIGNVQIQLVKATAIAGSGKNNDLPEWLQNKKCTINIDNDRDNDKLCFLYAIAANFFHNNNTFNNNNNNTNLNRIEKYREYVKEHFNFSMLLFPVDPIKHSSRIKKFEQINNMSINIFKINNSIDESIKEEVVPIYITNQDKFNKYPHINLLYHENHFWTVTKLHVLLRPKNKKCKNAYQRCNYCFELLSTFNKIKMHEEFNCQQHKGIIRTFPPPKTTIKFSNFKYQQIIPITLYWDTEVYQEPVMDDELKRKGMISKHILSSWCISVLSKYPNIYPNHTYIDYRTILDQDGDLEDRLVKKFMTLQDEILKLYFQYLENPIPCKDYEKHLKDAKKVTNCYFCKCVLNDTQGSEYQRIVHHDHFTGEFIAVTCHSCNSGMSIRNLPIPCIAHNSKNYDNNFIIRGLSNYDNMLRDKYYAENNLTQVEEYSDDDDDNSDNEETEAKVDKDGVPIPNTIMNDNSTNLVDPLPPFQGGFLTANDYYKNYINDLNKEKKEEREKLSLSPLHSSIEEAESEASTNSSPIINIDTELEALIELDRMLHSPRTAEDVVDEIDEQSAYRTIKCKNGVERKYKNKKKKYVSQLSVLPKTDNKFLLIKFNRLYFIDSYQFLPSSLDSLTKSLYTQAEKEHGNYKKYFSYIYEDIHNLYDGEDRMHSKLKDNMGVDSFIYKYCLNKGYFPYEYVDRLNKYFNTTELPPKECFYSTLKGDITINDHEYTIAKDCWNILNCKNLMDYNLFYLRVDVLTLTSVFEHFRNVIWENFKLDPLWHCSSPGLSWSIFLKCCKLPIELISDQDMFDFIQSGLIGGISMIGSLRYAKSWNHYQPEYIEKDKIEKQNENDQTYIIYMDYNSLYPSTMASMKLPYKDFEWVKPTEDNYNKILRTHTYEEQKTLFNNIEWKNNELYGYILEVDISPPSKYRQKFSEYPLLPERKIIDWDDLSKTQQEWAEALDLVITPKDNCLNKYLKSNVPKIVCDLRTKYHYIIHYQYLKFAVYQGYKVHKIHRIIRFKEAALAETFVNMNHQLRREAKLQNREADADTFKLILNSAYGKTCENVEHRCSSKLVNNDDDFLKCSSNPFYKSYISIDGCNLRICKFKKYKCYIDKPSYMGMAILCESKRLMAKFWYQHLYRKYGDSLRLLMSDTDSFIFQVKTQDFYRDIMVDKDFESFIDTGNINIPYLQKQSINYTNYQQSSELNLMKIEENKKGFYSITQFVGIKPKMYAYEKVRIDNNEHETKMDSRAKGVNKSYREKTCDFDFYHNLLKNGVDGYNEPVVLYSIQSKNQTLYTKKQEKLAFSIFDTKRYYLDIYHSIPYNDYYNINNK